jgi:hypothetical protein
VIAEVVEIALVVVVLNAVEIVVVMTVVVTIALRNNQKALSKDRCLMNNRLYYYRNKKGTDRKICPFLFCVK